MKGSVRVGTTGENRFVVEPRHVIDFADGGMPAVLCTPWLTWFLEHAAREAVLPLLEEGESTVGVQVEVRHLAPTPVGQSVTCRARVVHAEGGLISFQLEAHDQCELIARGFHKLQVIRVERFAQRVRRKTPSP
jgi:fluoroacetyl-CoA thioesterase